MRTIRFLLAATAATAAFSACDGHHHPAPAAATSAPVQGRVMDDLGQVVPGASVSLAGTSTPLVQSDARGMFLVDLPNGSHELVIGFHDVELCRACVTVAGQSIVDLGDLYPGRDSGCGRRTGCTNDADCDGLSDPDEERGWEVAVVDGSGALAMRSVTSDPQRVDTDGDGVDDATELAVRTDPRRRDTDGDGLPDFAELFAYKSNPWMTDSDGDARGPSGSATSDPNLWDGFEILFTRTSPTLADTDGDGLTDYQEVHGGGTDPRVADLPRMTLDVHGDPSIVLNVTDTSTHQTHAIASTLQKESEGYQRTDTESTKMSIENTVALHTETSAGTSSWWPSFEAKLTTDTEFKHGYATESLSSWTEESVHESQQNYEAVTSGITNINYDDGMLWTAIKIANNSDLAFRVRDLRITAHRMKPSGSFETIGTLALGSLQSSGWVPYEGGAAEFLLGPSVEYVGVVGADQLPPQVMRALVSNPTALLFEIGSYSLHVLDASGNPSVDFAVLGESIAQRTGLIVVDYGNGTIERYMVATNVHRYPDGSARGVRLGDALDLVGVAHETAARAETDPRRVLTKVGTVQAYVDEGNPAIRGLWVVAGTAATFDARLTVDFDDVVVRNGDRIVLTFAEDTDGDGVLDREEYLLGTDRQDPDTDDDGVTDYDETKVGWEVAIHAQPVRVVHADPRFADLDGDFLVDGTERALGTDPYSSDTDGDGLEDAFDPSPLVPPCLDGAALLLSAWWNGASLDTSARDVWSLDGAASHGTMFDQGVPASIAVPLEAQNVFLFNEDGDRIDVPDPPAPAQGLALSPVHEFSVALRVRWMGPPPTVPPGTWGTVLGKGPRHRATYGLAISDTGALRFSVFRRVFNKRWGWFFGWVDSFAEDYQYDELTDVTELAPLPVNQWVHVVATFGADAMRIYVDGVMVEEASMDVWSYPANIREHRTTEYLHGNTPLLRLGADQAEAGHALQGNLHGYLDDVQYFHRALTAAEVGQLFQLGTCGGR
jgi:hypothetical protein